MSNVTAGHALLETVELCAFPTGTMLLGAIIALFYHPGPKLTSAFMFFGAGVVFAAVSLELVPKISQANQTGYENLAMAIGFSISVAVMMGLGKLFEVLEGGDDSSEESGSGDEETPIKNAVTPSLSSGLLQAGAAFAFPAVQRVPDPNRFVVFRGRHRMGGIERGDSLVMMASHERTGHLPLGMIAAVIVDAMTDGLLIGIAQAAGANEGILIAVALSIEMCFLGISTSTTMYKEKVRLSLALPVTIILPFFIMAGGAIGATILAHVSGPIFTGILAFGTAALLYLVTCELLVEAREDEEANVVIVTVQFFVGFLLTLVMDQYTKDV